MLKNGLEACAKDYLVMATTKVACSFEGEYTEVGGYRLFALPFSEQPSLTNKSIEVKVRPLCKACGKMGEEQTKDHLKGELDRAFPGYNINFWLFPAGRVKHTGWNTACKGFCLLKQVGSGFDLLLVLT